MARERERETVERGERERERERERIGREKREKEREKRERETVLGGRGAAAPSLSTRPGSARPRLSPAWPRLHGQGS